MKLSINTVLYVSPFKDQGPKLFPKFKAWGFDAVELLVEDPRHINPHRLKQQLDQPGLACGSIAAAITPDRDLRGAAAAQNRGVAYLYELIDHMTVVEAPVLSGPLYSYVGRTDAYSAVEKKRQWRAVVKNLKKVAAYAAAHNKLVCVEPINRFESDFLNTMEQGLQLIKDVAHPALKLHLDTFHANIEEKNLPAAIRRAGKHLGHIHACGSDRGTPGKDHTDWKGMARALRDIKYSGDIVLETVTVDVPRIARSAAVWRRMEPTRDEIAREGVKFFKQLFK